MKKIALLFGALALLTLASCEDKGPGVNLDNVVEDGFFVAGPATGSEEILAVNAMVPGFNEKTKENRDGMYEKYVVLEKGKDFYLTLNEGGVSTRYSAVLEDRDLAALIPTGGEIYDGNPAITIKRGQLQEGPDAAAMQVAETGLYHIVLDLNKAADLDYAQIIVVPCHFTMSNGDKKMEEKVEGNKYVWTWNGPIDAAGNFKFRHCIGWKITLDAGGMVKAETSFGLSSKPGYVTPRGGKDININKGSNVKVTLTYEAKPGEIMESFTYSIEGQEKTDFTKAAIGISGDLHSTVGNWSDPAGATLATYNAAESKTGVFVYDLKNLPVKADAQFKMRNNGAWLGFNDVVVEGINVEDPGDGNIKMKSEGASYDLKISIACEDGVNVSEFKVVFTKVGDLPADVAPEPTPEVNIANFPAVDGKVVVYAEGEWTSIWMWDAGNTNYTGGTWPGTAAAGKVTVDGVSYTKIELSDASAAGKTVKVILVNGGSQTGDSDDMAAASVMVLKNVGNKATLVASK